MDLANSGLSINPGALNFDASIQLAPVPEPGTWAMLLLGVGGVGVVLRRRSGLAVAAD